MGLFLFQAFGEEDKALIEEIAKRKNVSVDVVAVFYKKMLDDIEEQKKKERE